MDEWMVDALTSWKLFCFRLSQWPQRKWDRSCWEWRWVRSQNLKTLPTRSGVDSESASFEYRWCHRPAPRPLNPATSHNQQQWTTCLLMQKILSPSVYQLTSHFHLLVVLDFFSYCLFVSFTRSVSASLFLVVFKRHLQAGIWTTACWVVYSGSI